MSTTFIDTNGEMSFEDNERLKFIIHYLKKGASKELIETKDGRFVREDSELSFSEIWLPAAKQQQSKVDELKNNINLLNEALDIKEQLNQKLREREDELQKRVDEQGLVIAKIMSIASDLQKNWEMFEVGKKLEQALKGEGCQ